MRLAKPGPGWSTGFLLHRHGAIVIERDDCIVVRTPENPNCCRQRHAPRDRAPEVSV